MATTVKSDNVVPTELASRWELIVAEAAKRLFAKRKQIMEAIGARQYKGLPQTEGEAFTRWAQVRQDPEGLTKILTDNVKVTQDGQMLFPKELINDMTRYEARYRKGTETQETLPPLTESSFPALEGQGSE